MEDRVREQGGRAAQGRGQEVADRAVERRGVGHRAVRSREGVPETHDMVPRRRLVERDAERGAIERAHVDAELQGAGRDGRGPPFGRHRERVERVGVPDRETEPAEPVGEDRRERGHA